MSDAALAILHHLLVFGLVITIATELALTRPGVTAADVSRLARMDAGYGASAGLILLVGFLRVWLGAKGVDYYLGNAWFWAKMASFAAVGVLSVPPSMAFVRWRKAVRANPADVPTEAAVARVRRMLQLEIGVLLLIPVFAALMARYQG